MAIEDFTQVKITWKTRYDYRGPGGTLPCWNWACEQFGNPGQTYDQGFRWQWNTSDTFYFRDKADAVLFALKWVK